MLNNPLGYTDPSGGGAWTRIRRVVVRVVAAIANAYGCAGYYSAAVGAYEGAKNGGGLIGAVVGTVAGYAGYQLGGDFSLQAYAAHAALGCVNASVHGGSCGSCGRGAVGGVINTLGAQNGGFYAQVLTSCVSAAVQGGRCGHGAADFVVSVGTRHLAGETMKAYQEFQREDQRAMYRERTQRRLRA